MNNVFVLPRYDVRRAGRALAAVMRDPDDLPQVFTLIESLSGTAPYRLLARMKRTDSGARLLRDRPDIVPLLADRAALRALPEGSLGRAYLDFVESEGISAEGIRAASEKGMTGERPPEIDYVHRRMRDTHDLWHAVTGYKGDLIGELALLAFTLGQHWNSAVALLVLAGLVRGFGRGHGATVREGFRRGRRAAFLPVQEWESMLALPLSEVRERLRVGPPPVYTPVRSAELRAQGLLS
jgi:ubiquinone biosynthesis protein COQ4